MSDSIERLSELFEKFPGIGPRQAGRFVQYLLRSSPALRRELAKTIEGLAGSVRQCTSCFRFSAQSGKLCDICANPSRDHAILAVVATDADLAALERSGTFRGLYFVFGGTISLATDDLKQVRLKQLLDTAVLRTREGLDEIILAFPANPEGDATADRIRSELIEIASSLKITALGRGLSTGSELEYADSETIKNAFDSRR